MKFRPVRELLDQAMQEVVELPATPDALLDYLRQIYTVSFEHGDFKSDSELEVRPYCFDDRINWDTHLVTLDGKAVGYTDGPLQ